MINIANQGIVTGANNNNTTVPPAQPAGKQVNGIVDPNPQAAAGQA